MVAFCELRTKIPVTFPLWDSETLVIRVNYGTYLIKHTLMSATRNIYISLVLIFCLWTAADCAAVALMVMTAGNIHFTFFC